MIENNSILTKELHKAIIRKFLKVILISTLMDDNWEADFADMESVLR